MFDLLATNTLIQAMDKSMTLAAKRLELIASNMANIDTPGYRTQDFDFHGALKNELAKLDGNQMPIAQTHPMHFPISGGSSLPPTTDEIRPNYERNDGNDVSLDRESLMLARTQNAYTLGSNFAQLELRKIKQMIRDARS